jgi:hypothetical protein
VGAHLMPSVGALFLLRVVLLGLFGLREVLELLVGFMGGRCLHEASSNWVYLI